MAYFSNGTEGMYYQEQYCFKCIHWQDRGDYDEVAVECCPVWDAHFLFAYEECNNKSNAKQILDILIPQNGLFAGKCHMFRRVEDHNRNDQLKLWE